MKESVAEIQASVEAAAQALRREDPDVMILQPVIQTVSDYLILCAQLGLTDEYAIIEKHLSDLLRKGRWSSRDALLELLTLQTELEEPTPPEV